jgi:hypothetical protein
MMKAQDLKALAGRAIYLKPMDVADLPADVQDEVGSLTELFAVHNAQGKQVAFVASPAVASHLAALNNMTLVALH